MTKAEQEEFAVEIYRLTQRKQHVEALAIYEALMRVMVNHSKITVEKFHKKFAGNIIPQD